MNFAAVVGARVEAPLVRVGAIGPGPVACVSGGGWLVAALVCESLQRQIRPPKVLCAQLFHMGLLKFIREVLDVVRKGFADLFPMPIGAHQTRGQLE